MTTTTDTRTPQALRLLADEGAARFAALEADGGAATSTDAAYLARVELARQALVWAHETFGERLTVANATGCSSIYVVVPLGADNQWNIPDRRCLEGTVRFGMPAPSL